MADEDVFVYTGGEMVVPYDVVRIRVHPSVTRISNEIFCNHEYLQEVELSEGLLEIGQFAFSDCVELKRIKIPSTVTQIECCSFHSCGLEEVEFCEGLLTIDDEAFENCKIKRIVIPPTVTQIGKRAFYGCSKLEEIELNEGLLEIGEGAFYGCCSLKRITIPSTISRIDKDVFVCCDLLESVELPEGLLEIGDSAFYGCDKLEDLNIPSTVKRIGSSAFYYSIADHFSLPNGIESIGQSAFKDSHHVKFRVPPLITTIPRKMLLECRSMFSIELPEDVTEIEESALHNCISLRNVALHPNNIIYGNTFQGCTKLSTIPTIGEGYGLIYELKIRFDTLPIHKMIYYQSYNNLTVEQLNEATTMKKRILGSKFNPTGNLQDHLGMTPLHIMACSTVQNIELYKVLVTKYPENLITKDRWDALPLLYAVWGNSPDEIVHYLAESYKSLYPNYKLDWPEMMWTMVASNAPKEMIQNLFHVQQESFPDQDIDWWRSFIEELPHINIDNVLQRTFQAIVQCCISKRLNEIGLKLWREDIQIHLETFSTLENKRKRIPWLNGMNSKLIQFESEYTKLKEATTLLQLASWKNKMCLVNGNKKRHNKKAKIENSVREQCRISCGADIIIEHVLPYLVSMPYVEVTYEVYSDSEDGSEVDSDGDY